MHRYRVGRTRSSHQSTVGNLLARRRPVAIRRVGDQVSGDPIEVRAQSVRRIKAPISPPPASQARFSIGRRPLKVAPPARGPPSPLYPKWS